VTRLPSAAASTAAAQRGREGGLVGHGLVGGRDDQHRIGAVGVRGQRGQGQGRRGVAAGRLEQQGGLRVADLAQLLEQHEAVLLVADHQRRTDRDAVAGQRRQAQHRLLEQRAGAGQRQELLRVQRPAERPKPGAGAAGEDDGNDRWHGGRDALGHATISAGPGVSAPRVRGYTAGRCSFSCALSPPRQCSRC
jgi:hypothetical protein